MIRPFLILLATVSLAGAAEPIKALYIGGGCCHDYDNQKLIIKAGLEKRAHISVTMVQQGGTTTDTKIPLYETADWAKGYDVIIHHECFAGVKDVDFINRILEPHQKGVPAVVLHCAMHSYRPGDARWFEFTGVTTSSHGPQFAHEVLKVDGAHPIMKTFPLGWWNPQGELYRITKVGEKTHPLGTSKDQKTGENHVSVWTNDYRGTRVFGTTLGHHNATFESPEFMELLTRGTLWAAGKLEDANLKAVEPEVKLVPVDLAQGKPGTASSEETPKGNLIPNAFDDKPDTRWCPASGSAPQWLQVDLGKAQTVNGSYLAWEGQGAIYRYKIEGSADGQTWQLLKDASANTAPSPNTDAFSANNVRYLRTTFLGSSTGGWGSIRTWNVYGTEMRQVILNGPKANVDEALLKTVKVPANFEATIFAAPPAVNYPTFVTATPEGDVFVAQDKNGSLARDPFQGSILRARDLDGDGKADEVKRFVANVDSPRGLEWDGEWLYCLHPPHLSRYRDTNGDGVSDEEQVLVEGIAFDFSGRPADHTSNGITLGLDGWIYCAIGDFGFLKAKGRDGKELQFRGGGVVRVRPDGSGIHIFSRGTRNIYEVAVGPTLEAFSRDNTNDGGGWDVRLHHFTGLDNHGYPSLYRNFNEEIIQPLREYGGGSGVGSVWIDEPGYPEGYRNIPCTVDWGPGWVYIHDLEKNGATFKEVAQREFVNVPRATDATIDATGRLYVSSWKDGQFKYDGENIGYVAMVQPKGHARRAVTDFNKLNDSTLVQLLADESFTVRRFAQFELLRRGLKPEIVTEIKALANSASDKTACAALFTLLLGKQEITADTIREALRQHPEMATRVLAETGKPMDDPSILIDAQDPAVRLEIVRWLAATADGPDTLLSMSGDKDPVVSHAAINALVQTQASEVCLKQLDNPERPELSQGALRALQAMHEPAVVDGLIARLEKSTGEVRKGILRTLTRLHFKEGDWDASGWGTRPDTSGPYYYRVTWEKSQQIADTLRAALKDNSTDKAALVAEIARNQIDLDDSIPTVLKLAEADPALEKSLVEMVLKKPVTPNETLPVLIRVAQAEDRDGELRLNAARALARTNDNQAFEVAFGVAVKREQIPSIPHIRNFLRDDILNNPGNENRYEVLHKLALGEDEKASILAWSALLNLTQKKPLAPETLLEIKHAFAEAQAKPAAYVRLLLAIQDTKLRSAQDLVIAGASNADAKVVKAAQNAAKALKIDLSAAAKPKGPLIATLKVPDVLDAVMKSPGDPELGAILFNQQTCAACHTVDEKAPLKGPFLGNITGIYKRRELAQAILEPNHSIAQGFKTNLFELKDGRVLLGFVTKEAADQIEVRDIAGQVSVIKPSEVAKRTETEASMMPPGLVNALTVEEFASLIAYFEALNKK